MLAATASDTDGSVTNVEFFQGAASLGSVTISSYSVPVSNLATGSYTSSAVASDNGGLKATNAAGRCTVTGTSCPPRSPALAKDPSKSSWLGKPSLKRWAAPR
ncbi:MAG: Ig-like domain-containing protein [Verrucomicrobiota bacterium]